MIFCFYINRRLEAYVEKEVGLNERARIEIHIEGCERCRNRANQIRQRIDLMQQLPLLEPDDQRWNSIADNLYGWNMYKPDREAYTRHRSVFTRRRFLHVVATAAAFLIIAVVLFPAIRSVLQPDVRKGELNLSAYLDLIGSVAAAEKDLKEFPTAPGFSEVSRWEAGNKVGFPIIAPETLPGGYKLKGVRLYTRGALRALQLKYQNERDGFCVFQLAADSILSFGDQSSEECKIDGIRCRTLNGTSCAIYPLSFGRTQCVLIMRKQDLDTVDALIQAFDEEHYKLNHK